MKHTRFVQDLILSAAILGLNLGSGEKKKVTDGKRGEEKKKINEFLS